MSNGWHRKADTESERARRVQYNSKEHRDLRRKLEADVQAGAATCWRCGRWIPPGSEWHVGHDDHDRTIYRGPEHARCNTSAGARKANALRAGYRPRGRGTPPLNW